MADNNPVAALINDTINEHGIQALFPDEIDVAANFAALVSTVHAFLGEDAVNFFTAVRDEFRGQLTEAVLNDAESFGVADDVAFNPGLDSSD